MAKRESINRIARAASWILGAAGVGLLLPSMIVGTATIAVLFPIASFLPVSDNLYQIALISIFFTAILGIPVLAIFSAVIRSSWAPIGLGVVMFVCTVVGLLPSMFANLALEKWAYQLFDTRSTTVVSAIEVYQQVYGRPPANLGDLVPRFLIEVPATGMPAYPRYFYGPGPERCSSKNDWHLFVPLDSSGYDALVYCPARDYEALNPGEVQRVDRFGNWARFKFEWD